MANKKEKINNGIKYRYWFSQKPTTKEILDKLQAKEQECEAQRCTLNYYIKKTTQLLDDIDNYKQALEQIEDITDDYNRVEKTSQYYRDGFDEIQNIINKIKDN